MKARNSKKIRAVTPKTKSIQQGIFRYSTLALAVQLAAVSVYAEPQGGAIIGGAGSIAKDGSTTTIQQHTDKMAIDWQSFNVAADESVKYIQPDSSSIALNRVLSNRGSEILGSIEANGSVYLVNPQGVIFGKNATINVGGMLASGLDINPDDFMNGDFTFAALDDTEGAIINSGFINASTGGFHLLLGQRVENQGVIVASLGAVNLAAGKEAVVTFDNEGLMGVRVTREVLQQELGVDAAVVNSGEIIAEGGNVSLAARYDRGNS